MNEHGKDEADWSESTGDIGAETASKETERKKRSGKDGISTRKYSLSAMVSSDSAWVTS